MHFYIFNTALPDVKSQELGKKYFTHSYPGDMLKMFVTKVLFQASLLGYRRTMSLHANDHDRTFYWYE